MIYGEDVIASLRKASQIYCCAQLQRSGSRPFVEWPARRQSGWRGISGWSRNLRDRKAILRPGDLGIRESDATRDMLSAKTFEDIIELSGGLYAPPDQCRMR